MGEGDFLEEIKEFSRSGSVFLLPKLFFFFTEIFGVVVCLFLSQKVWFRSIFLTKNESVLNLFFKNLGLF